MSRAHNSWVAEPAIPPPYAQAPARHHAHESQAPAVPHPSSAVHLARQPYSQAHDPIESQRIDTVLPSLSHLSHRPPPPFHFRAGQVSPATTSPYHPPQSDHNNFDAAHPLPSPTQHDPKPIMDYSRKLDPVKAEPLNQDFNGTVARPPTGPSAALPYPSPVPRRQSAGNQPGATQSPIFSGPMPPPNFPQPAQAAAHASQARPRGADKVRDAAPGPASSRKGGNTAMNVKYSICVRQHPMAARSCGFGERDRRVIDPPPIIQVLVDSPQLSDAERRNILRHPWGVMHCTIWTEDGSQDCSNMQDEFRTNRRLMGTPVSSPFVGRDDNNEEGCFYCFPDLSVRTPGSFRLHFSLAILDPSMKKSVPVVAWVMSDVFRVYNAKDFPGMQASTPLTKTLKKQGCLISIKKGKDHTGIPRLPESGDEDEDDEDGGQRLSRPSKKYRK